MTDVNALGQVGPASSADGADLPIRLGRSGEQVVQELHGRFYEQTFRGNVYSDGLGLTSINASTFTVGGIAASTTPVVGLWNPATSTVNCAIIEASLGLVLTALAATGPGGFVWAMSVGNTAISTGSTPLNRKTLALGGAQAKGMAGVALTGRTNDVVVRFGSALGGGSAENVSFTATAVAMQTAQWSSKELFDGTLIVPPGGVLALLATTTPVAHSAVSALVWEEVPV